jgi:biotin operon repressor
MSNQKDHESKENLDRCYKMVLQSSAKGISADEIGRKLNLHRTTVYHHLNSLQLMGKVESKQGIWYPKTAEQTDKPLEKEIVIELPMPKNKWFDMARLATLTKYLEEKDLSGTADLTRIFLEKFNETRTIRIKGKNVDDLDLEKIGNLIQQATKKSSNFDLKGLLKNLKNQLPSKKKTEQTAPSQNTVPDKHS